MARFKVRRGERPNRANAKLKRTQWMELADELVVEQKVEETLVVETTEPNRACLLGDASHVKHSPSDLVPILHSNDRREFVGVHRVYQPVQSR